MLKRRWSVKLVALASCIFLCMLAGALYWPFLANPWVFDDLNIYYWPLSHYATTPLGWGLRLPAYFSVAFVQTIWGHTEVHRVISLVLHAGTGLLLYAVLLRLMPASAGAGASAGDADRRRHLTAAGVSGLFIVHPAAVYGSAYLIQRSIVLATFFSLLALLLFLRGASERRYSDAVSAAVISSLAILSKEHAVLFPAVALLSLLVTQNQWRFSLRYGTLYALLCLPAALMVVILSKQHILTPYELQFDTFVRQSVAVSAPTHPWLDSVATQTGLFLRYLATWFWPRVGALSVDARVDLLTGQPNVFGALLAGLFIAVGIVAGLLLRMRGPLRLAGFGLLYVWVQFFVDMSTVRLQEPFVIYRSYLWAPGIAIFVAAVLRRAPERLQAAAFVAVGALLFVQAHDRLTTFSDPLLLWEDAAAKLPPRPILGDVRVYSNLAREYALAGRADDAVATISRCTNHYPDDYKCAFARGAIHLFREDREEYELAREWLTRAIGIRPRSALAHHHLGLAYEKLEQKEAAEAHYAQAASLGFIGGDYRLELMESTTGIVTLYRSKAPETDR